MRKSSGLILSLGISGITIFWLFHAVDWQEVKQSVLQINGLSFLVGISIYLLTFLPRGLRWKLMLTSIKNVTVSDSTQVVVLGYAANNLLPFRLGELVRAYTMGRKYNISKVSCLGSIAAERVIDGIVIVSLLGLSMIFLTAVIQQTEALQKVFLTGGGIFLIAVFLIIIFLSYSDNILDLWKRKIGQKGLVFLEKSIHSITFFRSKKILIQVLLLSICVWLLEGTVFVVILWTMGINNPVAAGYFCLGIVNLGILLPSAPGYVGVFQAASVFAFIALGYSESSGLAYGLLVHIIQYIPATLTGIIIFIRFGYRVEEFYRTISDSS
jgi:uncharacterized protein (TIRG00374 family)